ncbi:MAG: 30S ribosomal protein S12 methylthiotransferase RimO [Candidatus Riflebacteria bacterium]|nr:30S ribosomal protein S12 methylthiotransferase RimO [Candidatus Riflebacteria bacterium]
MKFHLISLGCPKNTVDSEGVAAELTRLGMTWVPGPEAADLVLLNTCGFIKDAKEESLRHVFRLLDLKRQRPRLQVAVFGCLVQRYRDDLRRDIPEIDHLFTFFDRASLAGLVQGIRLRAGQSHPEKPRRRFLTPAHLGFLKIAEGCDNRCSYCTIPDIRGPFRPRPLGEIMEDARTLAATGAREISIIAQDTARYGVAQGDPALLLELVRQVGELPTVRWIRLHYLHPRHLDGPFLEALFRLPKVVPYFDIPFQHVSDRILALMNRGVTGKDLARLVGRIRRTFRRAVIRTTFIVGFPGETEDDFQELLQFIERHPIDRLGAFPYSPEEGTPAFKIRPRISKAEKTRRLDELMTLQQLLNFEKNQHKIDNVTEILIDGVGPDGIIGRTYGDAFEVDNSVLLPYDSTVAPGDFLRVRITGAEAYDLKGERIP